MQVELGSSNDHKNKSKNKTHSVRTVNFKSVPSRAFSVTATPAALRMSRFLLYPPSYTSWLPAYIVFWGVFNASCRRAFHEHRQKQKKLSHSSSDAADSKNFLSSHPEELSMSSSPEASVRRKRYLRSRNPTKKNSPIFAGPNKKQKHVLARAKASDPEVVNTDGDTWTFRQRHCDDGPADSQPWGIPRLALQAVAKPPPGTHTHANPPIKTLQHAQRA